MSQHKGIFLEVVVAGIWGWALTISLTPDAFSQLFEKQRVLSHLRTKLRHTKLLKKKNLAVLSLSIYAKYYICGASAVAVFLVVSMLC